MKCACEEGRAINGGPITDRKGNERPESDRHDCQYVKRRNALIQEAEQWATSKAGSNVRDHRWSRLFLAEMDRLASARGIAA